MTEHRQTVAAAMLYMGAKEAVHAGLTVRQMLEIIRMAKRWLDKK